MIPAAEREQPNFDGILELLKMYKPKKGSKLKGDLLINAQNFYDGREMIINAFKNKMFPKIYPHDYSEYEPPKSDIEDNDREKDDKFHKEFSGIDNKVDHELIKKYFKKESLLELFKYLKPSYKTALNNAKNALKLIY